MNLLIEQRLTTLTSSKSQQQSQLGHENDMNNSSSPSSPLVLKIKRHTTKQHSNDLSSPSSHMSEEDHHSPSTPNVQRLKRSSLPQTTATRRPSSPAFNGKQQQATKRSVTIDNNNNDLTSHIDDISATKRFKRDDSHSSSSSKVDACVETVSVGLATEPDHLGPCEPGTSVVLEGIVWNETDSGVLVVNVTWRGKTYVGTLLDSTKQDWACPRLTCESPTSDYDPRSSSKTSRSKRNGASGTARCITQQSVSLCQQIASSTMTVGVEDRKLRNNIKSRQSKRLSNLSTTIITEEVTSQSSPLTSPYRANNQPFFPSDAPTTNATATTNLEPQLISCSQPQCHKRFASTIALNYHLSNAHKKTEATAIIPQANTRDEEDVAHILANVADYVRRTSPPSSMRCSPEHQQQAIPSPTTVNSPPASVKSVDNCSSTALSWPCPQISSKLVLPSPLNNTERAPSPNPTRCKLNNNDTNHLENKPNIELDDSKSSIRPADHFLLHIQDEPAGSKNPSSPSSVDSKTKKDSTNQKKRSKPPTPSPPPPPPPPTSSSPAYSDISDEEPIPDEQTLPPSTVNLLTATNGKIDENGNNLHSSSSFLTNSDLTNPAWTAQMLFQQFGPLMQQQALATAAVSNNKDISTTPNRLNSNNTCPSSNGTSDSTVKNILDARRSSTSKISSTSSSPPLAPPTSLYHYPTSNESKFPTPIINTLTSPNENLLHLSSSSSSLSPSTTSTAIKPMDILDYSLNNSRPSNGGQYHHSSSLHPSR